MITLLSKLFIKNREQTSDSAVRSAYGVLCGCVGIGLNIILFLGKLAAGLISNSIAITADALNNLSDAGSSVISLIGFKLATKKPDPDHPYGHGRAEYISGLIVSFAIILMAVELIKSSFEKILHPEETSFSILVVVILLFSILVKCYMAYYNSSIAKTINSAAMKATATDSLSDCIATSVVLIATLISHFGGIMIDGYCGILVGIFILYAGYNAAKDTISPLLGQPPEEEFVEQIERLALSEEIVIGVHDLIVHDYGPGRVFISLHAEIPASENMMIAHDKIDNLEHMIHSSLGCETVIHMDPICQDDELQNKIKTEVAAILATHEEIISFHDFRFVSGPSHTNLLFDIVVNPDFNIKSTQLLGTIRQEISETMGPEYFAIINIDFAYTHSKS